MLKQKKLKVLLFIVCGFTAFIYSDGSAEAATRHVPSQYPTITAAINASGNNDTILVGQGVYREFITVVGKYVQIKATGSRDSTIIVPPGPGRTPIMIQQVPTAAGVHRVKISGFKITEGNAPDGQGGGITIANNADPIIENNLINQNRSVIGGGIVVFNNSNPTIKNNHITYNDAVNMGGGIFVVKNSSPIIYGNTIRFNEVKGYVIPLGGSGGGGLYLENDPYNAAARTKPVIVNNNISNNHADFAGGAIMLRVGVDIIIEGNNLSNNSASFGGGVHVETEGSSVTISNNTINNNVSAHNPTFGGSGYGAGIAIFNKSKTKVYNNQIMNNQSSRGGAGVVSEENSNNVLSGNLIASNTVTGAATNNTYCGGGVYVAHSQLTAMNNIIRNNYSALGGGFCLTNQAKLTAVNNTVVKNNAITTLASAAGGGLYIQNGVGASGILTNNIFVMNRRHQIYEEGAKLLTTLNNIFDDDNEGMYHRGWSQNDVDFINSEDSMFNATGNIKGVPNFVDEANSDYSLTSSGIATDAGATTTITAEDYLKKDRPFNAIYDIGAYEYTTQTVLKSPVYRFWSEFNKGHFYTNSTNERNNMMQNYSPLEWRYEFVAYNAYAADPGGTTPVYRFWSKLSKSHFYTISSAERDMVINNYTDDQWKYEGEVYRVFPLAYVGQTNDVFRFWSPNNSKHFYTASASEKTYVENTFSDAQWTYENRVFKVPK